MSNLTPSKLRLHPANLPWLLLAVCGSITQPAYAQPDSVGKNTPLFRPTKQASPPTDADSALALSALGLSEFPLQHKAPAQPPASNAISTHGTLNSSIAELSPVLSSFQDPFQSIHNESAAPVIAQSPNPTSLPPGRDAVPINPTQPQEPLTPPEIQEAPLDSPEQPQTPEVPETQTSQIFTISAIDFLGNNVFSSEHLLDKTPLTTYANCKEEKLDPCPLLESILNTTLSATELYQVAADVAGYYAAQGYQTTGAVIDVTGAPEDTTLTIQIIEDQLENLTLNDSPLANYVQDRLGVSEDESLNVSQLQDELRLLQIDPLIDRVAASLTSGSVPGRSRLAVEIDEAPAFSLPVGFNNSRSPSVGSNQQQITFKRTHVFGIGDTVTLGYTHSEGSDSVNAGYSAILNPNNDTLSFNVNHTDNRIIEAPFDRLNILSDSTSYDLTYRSPLYRSVSSGEIDSEQPDPDAASRRQNLPTYEEFALTLGTQLRDSNSSLSGIPFQFTDVAEASGHTRSFVLQFGQEWTRQNALQVFSLRSKFSLGLDAFGATITPEGFPVRVPDGRFFAWRGQGQWVRLVDGRDPNLLFVLRGDVQLTGDPLLSSDKFSLGGAGTVRGYRQDSLVTDNGALISAELLVPLLKDKGTDNGLENDNYDRVTNERDVNDDEHSAGGGYDWVLQVIPFVDYGYGWNSSGPGPLESVRAAAGIGLQWKQEDFQARLDVGFPLVDVESSNSTWQENGIHFSVQYNPQF